MKKTDKKLVWQCKRCDLINENLPDKCSDCNSIYFTQIEWNDGSVPPTPMKSLREEVFQLLIRKQKDEATELLVNTLQEDTKFYATRFDERNEMYYYEGGIYKPNAQTFINEFCRYVLKQAYTQQLANRVGDKIEAENYIDQGELLMRHYKDEIVVNNGILNLKTRTLEPYTREKIFLMKIPIDYNPKAKCPAINNFFDETLPSEDDIKTIEEFFAYCLYGGYPIQKIALLLGEGGNGKGQMLSLLRAFLGKGNYSGVRLQKLLDNDFKEVELFGKLANIGGDVGDKPLKETDKLKGLSGDDTLNASKKFKNDIVFENEAKLVFAVNKLPKTYDLSPGFFRRWIYIVFPYSFLPEEEYNKLPENKRKDCKIAKLEIINKIITPQELSGFLNVALDAGDRLFKKKSFTGSKSQEETKNWWIRNSDSFLAFCWETIELDAESFISKKDLRRAYGRFCRSHKIPAEGDKHIKQVITRELMAWDDQETESGDRLWNGIRFKTTDEETEKIEVETEKITCKPLISPISKNNNLPYKSNTMLSLLNNKNTYILVDGYLVMGICDVCSLSKEIVASENGDKSSKGLCEDCYETIQPKDVKK